MTQQLEIPHNLASAATDGRGDWLRALPEVIKDVAGRWSLSVGPPFQPGGSTAWVSPARRQDGSEVVLKVAMSHPEADHEADGLRLWNGDGAVLLFDVAKFNDTTALLLERCVPATMLAHRPAGEQDHVVSGLLRRLWRVPPAGHPFRPLAEMCATWADQFDERVRTQPSAVDAGLVREGIGLFRSLPQCAARDVVLVTDLHAENILASHREPWLVIDPKPHVGDPTYDVLQHMLTSTEPLHGDPRGFVQRMADLAELDHERLALWLFARCVQESLDWPALGSVAARLAPC
ncbi:MAG: kinase [Candidatus Dormibacteraeota bacterium]|nr:kinase [Candidatus Dormibacteraeota bacterium]